MKKSLKRLIWSKNSSYSKVGAFVFSILVGVLVTVISMKIPFEQNKFDLLLGLISTLIVEFLFLVFHAIEGKRLYDKQESIVRNNAEMTKLFLEIDNYNKVISQDSHGKYDLFTTYARKEIDNLNSMLYKAAILKEFSISSDYILNVEGVFEAFNQSEDKSLRMTFPISSAEIFESAADTHFFEVLCDRANKGCPNKICILLIIPQKDILEFDKVKLFLDFCSANEAMEAKYCFEEEFRTLLEGNDLMSQFIDFGVYGDSMLFITEQTTPKHKGTYYKNKKIIERYSRVFDEIWDSYFFSHENPSKNKEIINIKEIF